MTDFNTQIIDDFRSHDGYVGAPFHSDRLVLLHHVGAKSGTERVSPLMSFPEENAWVVVASKGGAPEHPAWFHNLLAHPDVEIEYGSETIPVRASEVVGPERDSLWSEIIVSNPGFAAYEKRAGRVIPLVRLTRR